MTNAQVYWSWIPEANKWAQYDFSDEPVIDGKANRYSEFDSHKVQKA